MALVLMERSEYLDRLIHRCEKTGHRATLLSDGRIQPEGEQPMSGKDFAHWVYMVEEQVRRKR